MTRRGARSLRGFLQWNQFGLGELELGIQRLSDLDRTLGGAGTTEQLELFGIARHGHCPHHATGGLEAMGYPFERLRVGRGGSGVQCGNFTRGFAEKGGDDFSDEFVATKVAQFGERTVVKSGLVRYVVPPRAFYATSASCRLSQRSRTGGSTLSVTGLAT